MGGFFSKYGFVLFSALALMVLAAAPSLAQGTAPTVTLPPEPDYSVGFNTLLARIGSTVAVATAFMLPLWAIRHAPEIIQKLAGRAAR